MDDPGRVRSRERDEDGWCSFELEVAPEDRGRVIGQRGRTADALRTVLDAVAERAGPALRRGDRWMTPRAFADLVAIGRVVKPQGRKGEVLDRALSDRPDRFPALQRAFVPAPGGGAREMAGRRLVLAPQGPLRAEARRGRLHRRTPRPSAGQELRIGEEELDALPEGSYYHHQLAGPAGRGPDGAGRSARWPDILETGAGAPVLVDRRARASTSCPWPRTSSRRWTSRAAGMVVALPEMDRMPLRIDVVTIFPRMLEAPLAEGIVAPRARGGASSTIRVHDLRDFTDDRHRTVDDAPFGGGPGMVMKAEPFFRAVESRPARGPGAAGRRRPALAPRAGASTSARPSATPASTAWCCSAAATRGSTSGWREGVATEELSLGDFVLTGGRGGGARRDRGHGAPAARRPRRRGLGARPTPSPTASSTSPTTRGPPCVRGPRGARGAALGRPRPGRAAGAARRRCGPRASAGPTSSRSAASPPQDEALLREIDDETIASETRTPH